MGKGTTSHTLTHLLPGAQYEIRMAIFTSERMEPYTGIATASTSGMFELHRQSFSRSNYIVVLYMAGGLVPHAHDCIARVIALCGWYVCVCLVCVCDYSVPNCLP